MRTKTLLLTATLVAAGVASSMAQSNVYSLNVVGYVNVTVNPGFNMIQNPLDDGAGDLLTNVIGNAALNALPDSSVLFPWTPTGYGAAQQYLNGFGWFDGVSSTYSTNKIPPGAGFFLQIPTVANGGYSTNITFVGTVLQGTTTNQLQNGFTMAGSTFPESIPLGFAGDGQGSASMQLPIDTSGSSQDTVFFYLNNQVPYAGSGQPAQTGFYSFIYANGYGWFDGNNPSMNTNGPAPAVAESFFIQKFTGASPWVQSFTVQ